MIAVENTVLVLLAAGRSARYGAVDSKLDHDFFGRPLGLHVAVTVEDMPFRDRVAVVGRTTIDYTPHGFTMLRNDAPEAGIASSIRIGVAHARERGADAVMIALADMPRVTATHLHRLFEGGHAFDAVVGSSDGRDQTPPALFGRDRFDVLLALSGDAGPRDLVRAGKRVITAPAELIDVDTQEELERLRELVGSRDSLTRAGARRSD